MQYTPSRCGLRPSYGRHLVGGEVLELDEAVGPLLLGGEAELLHRLHVLIAIQPRVLATLRQRAVSTINPISF